MVTGGEHHDPKEDLCQSFGELRMDQWYKIGGGIEKATSDIIDRSFASLEQIMTLWYAM